MEQFICRYMKVGEGLAENRRWGECPTPWPQRKTATAISIQNDVRDNVMRDAK